MVVSAVAAGAEKELAVLETWARLLGWYDYAVKHERHVVWDMAWSQKADVSAERKHVDAGDDGRPQALATRRS